MQVGSLYFYSNKTFEFKQYRKESDPIMSTRFNPNGDLKEKKPANDFMQTANSKSKISSLIKNDK